VDDHLVVILVVVDDESPLRDRGVIIRATPAKTIATSFQALTLALEVTRLYRSAFGEDRKALACGGEGLG
jgi:hypothetical protein